jgi:hypothetical protein
MATERLARYVVLHVRRRAGVLEFEYTDSEGRQTADFQAAIDALRKLTRDLKPQLGPYQTGVSPLAVFVRGKSIDGPTLYQLERQLSLFVDPDRIQLVALPDRDWTAREFQLPLDVAYTSRATGSAFSTLMSHGWPNLPEVRRYGLRLHRFQDAETPADIVFVDDRTEARRIAGMPDDERPRLIVTSGFEFAPSDPLRNAVSWLCVPAQRELTPQFVNDLIYGIVHDQPLHEVLKSATRHPDAPRTAYLTADPASVNDLRMWDAMQQVAKQAIRVESRRPAVDVKEVLERKFGAPAAKAAIPRIRKLDTAEVYDRAHWSASELTGNFQREQDSLVVMARARARFEEAQKAQSKVAAAAAKDAKLRDQLAEEPRRVDAVIVRGEPDPDRGVFVDKGETLLPAQPYVLTVFIGQPIAASVVAGDVPAIDPLLPPPPDNEGHLLHVAVYPLDFELASPTIQRLILPTFGSSEPVFFSITAPKKEGPARLRIAVYYDADLAHGDQPACYHNHLLQSFLLEAEVTDTQRYRDEATVVRLEFSRTEGFTQLAKHERRVASLAVNTNGADTHTLMLKEAGNAASLGVSEQTMQQQLEVVRESLLQASTKKDANGKLTPRFPEGVEQLEAFETAIRDLAEKGRNLTRRLFSSGSDEAQDILSAIAGAIDEVVQVVRLQDDFYFPWTLLYDFPLPERIAGQTDKPVCDGFTRKHPDGTPFTCRECLANCLYPGKEKEKAYCVYGFWGTRLQVEQSLHKLGANEEATKELTPFGDHSILYVSGLTSPTALNFPKDLEQALGDARWIGRLGASAKLVEKLWSDDRPAVLVVLGHLQVKAANDQPVAARIRITDDDWLIAERITDKAMTDGRWKKNPRSVIILAACDSAASDLLSMNDFIKAFGGARAGAVVGTETTVFESLARTFARELSKALLDRRKLGEAVLDFRRRLLLAHNPLGLMFTAFGHAGLQRADGAPSQ